jgi:hypothetical protein
MATLKVRICVRCEENRFSEITWDSVGEVEEFLTMQMELLMKQLYGRKVIIEQVIVARDPLDAIAEDDIQQLYD